MYSVKKNVLQAIASIKAYNIRHIVISPGSRNSPLIQSFSQDSFFDCHLVVDERNAAFYALGIIQATEQPVVICCTSGTALLNYAPAVAEAYYQKLPLIVISADRAQEWIGQMDGQTIPQIGALGSLVRRSVQIPEVTNEQDVWYCNRLLNEALIACEWPSPCPVQINIPISEPLFDYSEEELPAFRKIHFARAAKSVDTDSFLRKWISLPKRLIVVGQLLAADKDVVSILETLCREQNCAILAEHTSNCFSKNVIHNFDTLLYGLSDEDKANYRPDVLITFGGHVVSKRLKQFIRTNKPKEHWHLSEDGQIADLYQSLTDVIETDFKGFLSQLSKFAESGDENFSDLWTNSSKNIEEPRLNNIPFSDISVTGDFFKKLPHDSHLHLANSSPIRNAQLFPLHPSINVNSNRGTNGIEGSLSTTIGFASVCGNGKPVYLVIGDLSFFYAVGALWNIGHIKNLRILLINNRGGGIFHLLPGLNQSASLKDYVVAQHTQNASKWAEAAELKYLSASNKDELSTALDHFFVHDSEKSIILEVTTDIEISKQVMHDYYRNTKKNE